MVLKVYPIVSPPASKACQHAAEKNNPFDASNIEQDVVLPFWPGSIDGWNIYHAQANMERIHALYNGVYGLCIVHNIIIILVVVVVISGGGGTPQHRHQVCILFSSFSPIPPHVCLSTSTGRSASCLSASAASCARFSSVSGSGTRASSCGPAGSAAPWSVSARSVSACPRKPGGL